MKKFETTGLEELESFKLRLSRTSGRLKTWKHEELDSFPTLVYTYEETDNRFSGREEELRLFRNAFWDTCDLDDASYKDMYERELREAIQEAVQQVNCRWQKILAIDLEKRFG